jgi:hypothetical protein
MRKIIYLISSVLLFLLSCSDNSADSGDPDGPWLEVSISSDSFATDNFTCVSPQGVDTFAFGALNGVSENGENVSVGGQFGPAERQSLSMNFLTEVWAVMESDDPSESVGAFIELSVDVDNLTASEVAAVEDTYHVESDGTDTMTFDIRC